MINLEVFGESTAMGEIAELLDGIDGVSRVRAVDATRAGHSVVVANVRPARVDAVSSRCVSGACRMPTSR